MSAEDEEGESGEDLQDVDQDLVEPELTLRYRPCTNFRNIYIMATQPNLSPSPIKFVEILPCFSVGLFLRS